MANVISICEDKKQPDTIETDGYLLIYTEGDKFLFKGKLGLKALTPLLTKILMEKMK